MIPDTSHNNSPTNSMGSNPTTPRMQQQGQFITRPSPVEDSTLSDDDDSHIHIPGQYQLEQLQKQQQQQQQHQQHAQSLPTPTSYSSRKILQHQTKVPTSLNTSTTLSSDHTTLTTTTANSGINTTRSPMRNNNQQTPTPNSPNSTRNPVPPASLLNIAPTKFNATNSLLLPSSPLSPTSPGSQFFHKNSSNASGSINNNNNSNNNNNNNNNSNFNTQILFQNSNSHLNKLKTLVHETKSLFKANQIFWSYTFKPTNSDDSLNYNLDDNNWSSTSLEITPQGELIANSNLIMASNLQSCSIQVISPLILKLSTYSNLKTIYFKTINLSQFENLISCLIVWSGLKPSGFLNKWHYFKSVVDDENLKSNELLVCRFKVYGPIPSHIKKLKYSKLPTVPIFPNGNSSASSSSNSNGDSNNNSNTSNDNSVNEGWFYTMGYLKSDGILELLNESDGSLLYSIDVTTLFSSEIRQVHHSIFQNSNILFLGVISELRNLYTINGVEIPLNESNTKLILSNRKDLNNLKVSRILISFDLRIDLEDWFVTLSSFTKREYIGTSMIPQQRIRCSKHSEIQVMEAKLTDSSIRMDDMLYCELIMWKNPWCRTAAIKNTNNNPFWMETFDVSLPASVEFFKIYLKRKKRVNEISKYNNSSYENDSEHKDDDINISGSNNSNNDNNFNDSLTDEIIGTVYVTPDMLHNHEYAQKFHIYDPVKNSQIGILSLTVNTAEYHILPYTNYKFFEKLLLNLSIEDLIEFVQPLIKDNTNLLVEMSTMLFDIYQTLNKEHDFFTSLMKWELESIDSMTRNNRISNSNINPNRKPNSKSNNTINTIFRGNSILSKTLEKYAYRVGQEYLEKVLGGFINQISTERLDCEIDPRLVVIENNTENTGIIETDSFEIKKKKIADRNIKNLENYISILWNKIYISSNDLPQEIKQEWGKLRSLVEMSVEPNDTETPLNALTSFVFLRFICPAILNPKLFYLIENHQTGRIQRTLTLVAKVLMTLGNRTRFQKHKDPYLLPLNDFLDNHESEILAYFDRITGRKMDFNEKILELNDSLDRPSLNVSDDILFELPTNPYLIDKYLRLVELIRLLNAHNSSRNDIHPDDKRNGLYNNSTFASNYSSSKYDKVSNDLFESHGPGMASLELEVLGFNDTDFGSEDFIKSLLLNNSSDSDNSDNEEDYLSELLRQKITLQELKNQASYLIKKTEKLEGILTKPESPTAFSLESWNLFLEDLFKRLVVDSNNNIVFVSDKWQYRNYKSLEILLRNYSKKLNSINQNFNETLTSKNSKTKLKNSPSFSRDLTINPFKKFFGKKK